ncbi:MAG: HDOD domain-containing protein [Campylobacterales bacterium]|nr:HDOD domain-containing protein [Campylobacterales bacterium]
MGFESIISKINSLPPFPQSIIKLEEAFRMGEPNMKTIVSIIEGDPLLTAGILAKVNAPVFGLKNHIVSVMQAVTLFGLNTVRASALKATMERNFEIDMSPYAISNEDFSKISAMQNALMFQWYMGIDVQRAKIMIPIAFIMETGKVLIAKEVVESSYGEMFRDALMQSSSISQVESDFTGTTSTKICALLFKHWNFETIFAELMENIDNEKEIDSEIKDMVLALKAVRTAINVKEQLSDASIEEGAKIVLKMGYDSTRFVNAARRIRENMKD